MGSKVTETELQVFFVPCPPEREASFRHGLMMLYDWLEELSKQNPPTKESPVDNSAGAQDADKDAGQNAKEVTDESDLGEIQ